MKRPQSQDYILSVVSPIPLLAHERKRKLFIEKDSHPRCRLLGVDAPR